MSAPLTDNELVVGKRLIEWASDPRAFALEALHHRRDWYWPKMREVAESVRDHQLTGVPAGHSC